ncbi:MAG: energy-coupling factor transporter transmembrane component T [Bacillota bacterium]|nr:energy-coupling factor transporter transmembrane component T [Bacillota bacterium]
MKICTETKLILILFFTTTMVIYFPFVLELINLLFVSILMYSLDGIKKSVKIVITFIFLTVVYHTTLDQVGIIQVFNTWAILIRRLLIPFSIGHYFIYSTNISSLLATMERLKVSNMVIIPFLVMFRYLPVLKDEYGKIKDAMKIRGIGTGINSLKTPELSLEYHLVPLLFSASNIGEELSQAAFSKGISIEGKKNRYFASNFGLNDFLIYAYLLMILCFLIGDK